MIYLLIFHTELPQEDGMYSHLGMILWCENEGFASKVTTKNTINYQAMSEHYGK
jgi:hypothetical protein